MSKQKAIFEYQRERGVLYVFDESGGECLLRVEGIPLVPDGHQVDIHLVHPGSEHHHEHCGNRDKIYKSLPVDAGQICAVKMEALPFEVRRAAQTQSS